MREAKEIEIFDQKQDLQKAEFDLLQKSEREKEQFQLAAEKARLMKILELNEQFSKDLNALQIETIKAQIQKLDQELNKIGESANIWDSLKITPEQQQGISEAFAFARQQVVSLFNTNQQIADQNRQEADSRVEQAESRLQSELALAEQGFSANIELRKRELAEERKRQAEAIADQRKAARAQQAIETIQQASSLVTAAAKIWAQLKFPLALPAIALMFGSFAAAKIRAASLSKKRFSKGGLEILGGGSHASGDDTYLGFQSEGKPAYGEKGEAVAIIPSNQTRKYMADGTLSYVINALRRGTFEKEFSKRSGSANQSSDVAIIQGAGSKTDMSTTNRHLKSIDQNTEKRFTAGKDGKLVRQYKNVLTVYE